MRMRLAAAAAMLSSLCVAPALAIQGDPVPGADVSAEQSPSSIIIPASQCKLPRGTLSRRADGKWICKLTPAAIAALKPAPLKILTPAATRTPPTMTTPGSASH